MKNKILLAIVLFLASGLLAGCNLKGKIKENKTNENSSKGGEKIMEKKGTLATIIAPKDFQEKEYFGTKEIFEENGYEVLTFSKYPEVATSSAGTQVAVDKTISNLEIERVSGIIFVGGPGTTVYFDDEEVLNLAKEAVTKGKLVGAICIAPSILANAGVLNGVMTTAYPSERKNLENKGALFINENVVVDGKIVTANGPGAAQEFAEKILETLKK